MRNLNPLWRHLLLLGFCFGVLLAGNARAGQEQAAEPLLAWNRSDRYLPPDFDGFFPDDPAAAAQLDLLLAGQLKIDSVDARLDLVRRGLRRASGHRNRLLGALGNEFIWNRSPQHPRAIELLYHASASPDAELAESALYHGLTVVSDRTPNLVRTLMQQYQSLDPHQQQRIVWGMRTYGDRQQAQSLLRQLLDQHANLDEPTVCAALDVYQSVAGIAPPGLERFDVHGQWVVAFHRTDLSADHPRAAKILRDMLDHISLRNQQIQVLDFVTRVDEGHETAVVLLKGYKSRTVLTRFLADLVVCRLDFNELLSPRLLQRLRLREFARHLPGGLPDRARPAYTRPPVDAVYAHSSAAFVAPQFEAFYADDAQAGAELDAVYAARDKLTLSDRELLDLLRRGLRSSQTPNVHFGWIAGALGWPRDPLLTECFYQALDPQAPPRVRDAAIYHGFGLGNHKTRNVLQAMAQVYLTPPFDRTTNSNLRTRILWGVRDHEDDKHFLAMRFAEALRKHESLSDVAVQQADRAFRELTGESPPNAEDYAERGQYLILFRDAAAKSPAEVRDRLTPRVKGSPHVIATRFPESSEGVMGVVVVRGLAGQKWLIETLRPVPGVQILFADLLNQELIRQSDEAWVRELEELLPPDR